MPCGTQSGDAGALLVIRTGACESRSEDLAESFAHSGRAELMAHYALLLPVMVMGWALGVPATENRDLVAAFTDQLAGGDRALAGHQYIRRTMQALVRRVRERPGADVASRLAADPLGAPVDEKAVTAATQPLSDAGWKHTVDGRWIRWTAPAGDAGVQFDAFAAQHPQPSLATWTVWAGPGPDRPTWILTASPPTPRVRCWPASPKTSCTESAPA
ncbi:hypothetical protein Srufu_076770 [Streptomyces libani subsp. rufus]|nr:hypothetical protein Srufu_076770 [Streptomyces libani subsp. rufus]